MRKILVMILTLAAMAAPSMAHAEGALAVVDMQQILAESDAAKSILGQMKTQRDAIEKEIKTLEDALRKDEQALIKERKTAKPEEFEKDRVAFEKKVAESRMKVQKKRGNADEAFNKAINQLRTNIVEVVSDIATEKKIQLVITKQNVVIGDKNLDITPEVMTKLNAKIKTIKVQIQ